MHHAEVEFSRHASVVAMTLIVDGHVVAESASQESIARELQIRGVRHLTIDGKFSTELPTVEKTLSIAGEVAFSELMAALKLIAACASFEETPAFPFPERRLKKRSEIDLMNQAT